MPFESLIATAAILVGAWLALPAYGQEIAPAATPISATWTGAQQESISAVTDDMADLTDLLQAQQSQLSEQAALLQQLQEDVRSQAGTATPAGNRGRDPSWIDIGGQYRVMYNASNFGFHPATLDDAQRSQTFFNQRFRTWLEVHPNEHVEGYLQVEMGHIGWGSNFDFPKTYVGPRFPASTDPNGDRVGVELRYGYLGYQNACLGRLRVGIQPWQDSFDQTLFSSDWDFSVGGLSWITTLSGLGDANMQFGIFALDEGGAQTADDAVLFTVDLDWIRTADHSLGFSAYYLLDDGVYSYPTAAPYASAWDTWLGVRATTTLAGLPVHAFVMYNAGEREELAGPPALSHDDAAAKLELGAIPIGPGAVSFQTLYSTGNGSPDDGFRTVAQSARDNFGSQGYWSYLVLTSPHGPSDVNDLGVSLQNRGLGLFTVQGKYDYPIYRCLSGTIAVGWFRSEASNPVSGASDMGTELANIFTLDFGGGLKAEMGAGVLFTGEFYKAAPGDPRPDDLYEAFTRLQLEF